MSYTYLLDRLCGVTFLTISFTVFLPWCRRMFTIHPFTRKLVFIFKSIQQNNRLAKFHLCGKNWATKSVLLKLSFESFFIFVCRSFDKSCFLLFKKSFFIVYLKKLYARNCESDNDTSCCND
jgi:hypothetical protein